MKLISETKYIYMYWCKEFFFFDKKLKREKNLFETPILEDLDLFTQTIITKRFNYPSRTYVIYICEKLNVCVKRDK